MQKLLLEFIDYDGTKATHHIFHNRRDMTSWLDSQDWIHSYNIPNDEGSIKVQAMWEFSVKLIWVDSHL